LTFKNKTTGDGRRNFCTDLFKPLF